MEELSKEIDKKDIGIISPYKDQKQELNKKFESQLKVDTIHKFQGTNIDDLIKYIQYNNFELVESKTKSIFDLLYKANRKQRLEYLKNKNRISEYDSENLIYNLRKY